VQTALACTKICHIVRGLHHCDAPGGLYAVIMALFPVVPQPSPEYIIFQPDINELMRAILVDWLWRVHGHNQVLNPPECLMHRVVDIIDMYLAKNVLASRKDLQRVGCAAMAEALSQWCPSSKMDIFSHRLVRAFGGIAVNAGLTNGDDYWTYLMAGMSDDAYTPAQVEEMRKPMSADCRLLSNRLTALCHIQHLAAAHHPRLVEETRLSSMLLCDYMLLELRFRSYEPKVRAVACVVVSLTVSLTGLECSHQLPRVSGEQETSRDELLRWSTRLSVNSVVKTAGSPVGVRSCAMRLASWFKDVVKQNFQHRAPARVHAQAWRALRRVNWENWEAVESCLTDVP